MTAARRAWVEAYEERAREFAACLFLEEVGSGVTAGEVVPVRELHDTMCQAGSGLPLA